MVVTIGEGRGKKNEEGKKGEIYGDRRRVDFGR